MEKRIEHRQNGLALVLLELSFGVGMGIIFGVNEDMFSRGPAFFERNQEPHSRSDQTKLRVGR